MFQMYGVEWDGTVDDPRRFQGVGGVYMVWCNANGNWSVLDVGESGDVTERLVNHDRRVQWQLRAALAGGEVRFAVHYTPGADATQRRALEHHLRQVTNPPCGER